MAIPSSLGIRTINDRVRSLGIAVTRVKKSSFLSSKILMNKTKIKRSSLFEGRRLFQRKKESARFKDQESIIEASKLVAPVKKGAAFIARSTKGFLGRLLDFAATLLTGWLLYNLPTIIAMAKELMGRITRMVQILKSFVGNIGNVMGGFGNLLGAVFQNITSFDFLDTSNRVKNAMNDLTSTFDDMGAQVDEGIRLITTSLGEGLVTGENAPPTGTKYPLEQPEAGAPTSSGGGGGRWKPLLDLIHSVESSTDKKNNGYDAQNGAPGGVRPGLSQMTIGEIARTAPGASGRYQQMPQFLLRRAKAAGFNENTVFSPDVQDALAIKLIEGRGGNAWLSGKMSTEQFMQGLANEWAALPNAYGQFSYSGQGSSLRPERVKATLNQIKANPEISPSSTSAQTSSPTPAPSPQKPKVDLKKLGFSVGERAGYSPSRGRVHAGRDIAIAAGTPVSVISDATITDIGFERGYGYFVAYTDSKGIEHFYGHLREMSKVKKGQKLSAGSIVGYVGSTGYSTGPHLHWEVSPRIGEVGRPRKNVIDPIEYGYASSSPFGGIPPAQIAAQPQQRRQQLPSQITPERKGQQIVLIDDIQPPPPPMPTGGGGGGMIPIVINPLNSYITNKLLLDLAYT